MENYSAARADAEQVVALQPGWPKGYNRLAFALSKLNQLEAAAAAKKQEGNCYFAQKEFKAAAQAFTEGLKYGSTTPLSAVFFSNRSGCYAALHSYSKALADAEQAIALKPDWVRGYSRAATACVCAKHFVEAEKFVSQGLELDANDSNLKSLAAQVKSGKLEEAKTKARAQATASFGAAGEAGNLSGDETE
mmetsp:Transcript_12073/g.23069  ORF Transcript_12073/g.23069 Transcript_12073/m.23069 type:complete len:192 (+) Transcript_12073:106-681(+)